MKPADLLSRARAFRPWLASLALVLAYAAYFRWAAGWFMGTALFSFLFLAPMALGVLTVRLGPPPGRRPWLGAAFHPWPTVLLFVMATLVARVEGLVCILVALPVFLAMSSLGGLLGRWMQRRTGHRPEGTALGLVLLLPLLGIPLERRWREPDRWVEVENVVRVRAPRALVWRNIVRVPALGPGEYRARFTTLLGFPKPLEAALDREGPGGLRVGRFEGDARFLERVTEWDEGRRLRFTLRADPDSKALRSLDPHVALGGRHFDLRDGTYELEDAGRGEVLLRFRSTHRVSTHYNAYAALWTRLLLWDIQEGILEVVKARCERQAVGA